MTEYFRSISSAITQQRVTERHSRGDIQRLISNSVCVATFTFHHPHCKDGATQVICMI